MVTVKDSQSSYKGESDLQELDQSQRVAENILGDLNKVTSVICLGVCLEHVVVHQLHRGQANNGVGKLGKQVIFEPYLEE